MGYTAAAETTAINAVKAAATYISIHTADPGTTGTSELTGGSYARVATTWGAASGSGAGPVSVVGSAAVINIPASSSITYWGLWTAGTGGTFYYGGALSASESFGAAGTYSLTPTLSATN